MKLNTLSAIAVILFFFAACSKSDNNPDPTPVDPVNPGPKSDTLTAGWTRSAAGTGTISDICFLNASVGYVAAKNIYKTVNGGVSWDSVFTTGDNFSKNLAIVPDGKLFFVNAANQNVYKSLDAAKTFTTTTVGALAAAILSDIYFAGADTGYAVSFVGGVYKTTDGGLNWLATSPISTANTGQYSSVYFINGTVGWVSVGGELYKTNGDINTWTRCTVNGLTGLKGPMSIYAASAAVVYLGYAGTVLKSTDGGVNFSIVKRISGEAFFTDIHFITELVGYVCHGYNIYKTTDGGDTWQTVTTTTKVVVEIYFTDASHGWACGYDGMTLRYNL